MPTFHRAAAATLSTALALSVLSPLATAPAAAADEGAVIAYLVDVNGDGYSGLSVRPADGTGTPRVLVPDWDGVTGDPRNLTDLAISPDGTTVVYASYVFTTGFDPVSAQLVVHELGAGGAARTLVDAPVSADPEAYQDSFFSSPSFSRDGSSISYGLQTYYATFGGPYEHYRVATAGGTPVEIQVTDNQHLLQTVHAPSGDLVGYYYDQAANGYRMGLLPAVGGTPVTVSGGPSSPYDLAFSSDGSTVAWVAGTPNADGTFSSGVFVGSWSQNATAATVGSVRQLAGGASYSTPGFDADGSVVAVRQTGPHDDPVGDIVRIPAAGGEAVPLVVTPEVERAARLSVPVTAVPDAPPGTVRTGTAVLNGTSAQLRYVLPTDPDLAAVLITRRQGTTVQKDRVRVAAPATSWTDTGLTVGTTYSYRFEAVDAAGNVGAATTRTVTATKRPVVTTSDPTSTTTSTTPFKVAFGTGNATSTLYTASWRVVGGTWASWLQGVAGATRTFGTVAATGVSATTSRAGSTYQFSVRAGDRYGNSTAAVTSGKAVVPADQSAATFSTGVPAAVAVSGAWLGSTRTLTATGHRATLPSATSDRFQVVGERRTDGGSFAVYRGSTKVATVSTYASSRKVRQVLWTSPVSTTTASWSVRWVPSGTTGRTKVVLDGFALRR